MNAKAWTASEDSTRGGVDCPEDCSSTTGLMEGIDSPLLKWKVLGTVKLVPILELILSLPKTFDEVALAKAKKESNAIQSQLTVVWRILSTSTDPSKLLHTWYNFREFVSTGFEPEFISWTLPWSFVCFVVFRQYQTWKGTCSSFRRSTNSEIQILWPSNEVWLFSARDFIPR